MLLLYPSQVNSTCLQIAVILLPEIQPAVSTLIALQIAFLCCLLPMVVLIFPELQMAVLMLPALQTAVLTLQQTYVRTRQICVPCLPTYQRSTLL